jgi:hypothetical protein
MRSRVLLNNSKKLRLSMQRWEYKTFLRSRGFDQDKRLPKAPWQVGTDWDVDIDKVLMELGNDGWELVAVTPRSSYLGGGPTVGGNNFAGFTSNELWVFKRPRS